MNLWSDMNLKLFETSEFVIFLFLRCGDKVDLVFMFQVRADAGPFSFLLKGNRL